MAQLDVIGIGHITCDIVVPLESWPQKDTKTIIPQLRLSGGGPTANAMAALARLSVPCGLAGRLGTDVLGQYTLEQHRRDGIDVSRILVSQETVSPVSVILPDLSDGTRTILLTKGENTTLAPGELDLDWLRQARVLHFDGHQMPASLAAATAARQWPGVTTLLDAGSMREGMLELCGLVDIVFASQVFARELSGSNEPQEALAALHRLGARVAGVTLGAQGSLASDGTQLVHCPARDVAVVDSTGAGDAFHGGFIYALLQDLPLARCLFLANAVAAIKCTGFGAREALPDRTRLEIACKPHRADSDLL